MKAVIRVVAAASLIVCALTTASLAGPESYCGPFARDAANRKMGQTEAVTGTIGGPLAGDNSAADIEPARVDDRWKRAYDANFAACMSNFATLQATVSTDPPMAAKVQATKPAAVKRTQAKRAVFPDGAEVSLPRHGHSALTKKATKIASRAKPARGRPAEPAAIQEPEIESTADTATTASGLATGRRGQAKDRGHSAKPQTTPEQCTNFVCWLKQRSAKQQ